MSRRAVVRCGCSCEEYLILQNAITAKSSFVKLLYTLKAQWIALECRKERSLWLAYQSTWSWAYRARTVSVTRAVSIATVWIRQRWDQHWSIQLCPNSDSSPVLCWMETHRVDQARMAPKLKHTLVSHLGFELGTSLNENHSQLPCDNPREAPV